MVTWIINVSGSPEIPSKEDKTMTELTEADIKRGSNYRAKRVRKDFFGQPNDRYVLWIGKGWNNDTGEYGSQVQYDSVTVKDGRHYPKVSMVRFLKWAKEEIVKPTVDSKGKRIK